jgi:membrane protein DedA with SNARE-associated domain
MKDFFRNNQTFVLALLILGTCFVIIAAVLFKTHSENVQMFILGALITTVSSVISYYFGSSIGSKDKQKKLDEINETKLS